MADYSRMHSIKHPSKCSRKEDEDSLAGLDTESEALTLLHDDLSSCARLSSVEDFEARSGLFLSAAPTARKSVRTGKSSLNFRDLQDLNAKNEKRSLKKSLVNSFNFGNFLGNTIFEDAPKEGKHSASKKSKNLKNKSNSTQNADIDAFRGSKSASHIKNLKNSPALEISKVGQASPVAGIKADWRSVSKNDGSTIWGDANNPADVERIQQETGEKLETSSRTRSVSTNSKEQGETNSTENQPSSNIVVTAPTNESPATQATDKQSSSGTSANSRNLTARARTNAIGVKVGHVENTVANLEANLDGELVKHQDLVNKRRAFEARKSQKLKQPLVKMMFTSRKLILAVVIGTVLGMVIGSIGLIACLDDSNIDPKFNPETNKNGMFEDKDSDAPHNDIEEDRKADPDKLMDEVKFKAQQMTRELMGFSPGYVRAMNFMGLGDHGPRKVHNEKSKGFFHW